MRSHAVGLRLGVQDFMAYLREPTSLLLKDSIYALSDRSDRACIWQIGYGL